MPNYHPGNLIWKGPWVKGQSGNPGGRPAGFEDIALQARALAPLAIQRLGDILRNDKAKPAAWTRAAELILERGFGKAPAFKTTDPQDFRDVLQLTDAQIRERLAALRAILIEHGIDPLTLPAPNGHGQVRAKETTGKRYWRLQPSAIAEGKSLILVHNQHA